jgi:hypothetical protein
MATESGAAAAYAALCTTAAAAEATAAETVAAAARATVDARAADAQATAAAMCTHPCHAFSGSPHFELLDARGSLRLVTDAVLEDDALCLALTCRALRDALWARFPRRPRPPPAIGQREAERIAQARTRVRTRDAAVGATVGRLAWARGLGPESRLYWRPWKICVTAARHGALASLQWARANGFPWDTDTCAIAAEGGHLAVLQWARANGCDWDTDTCVAAARGGHLALLQWARANGCDWDGGTC